MKIVSGQDRVNRLVLIMANNHRWTCDDTGEFCVDRDGCRCESCEGYQIVMDLRREFRDSLSSAQN